MVDTNGASLYTYSSNGMPLTEDGPWDNDVITYAYANRLRTSLSLQQPNASAWTQTYGHDSARRLTDLTSPAGAFSYAYGPATLPAKVTLPNGAYVTNVYDSVARLTATRLKTSGHAVLSAHEYAYNAGNQRTSQTRVVGSTGASTATNSIAYTYDNIGQLKTAKGTDTNSTPRLQEQFGYAYDPAGNLNYRTNNALVQTFTVDNLNQITNVARSGTLTVSGNTTEPATDVNVNGALAFRYSDNTYARTNVPFLSAYGASATNALGQNSIHVVLVSTPSSSANYYDFNGNLIYDGVKSFEYDDENQLTRITRTNNWRSEFTYDGKMRRRVRKEFVWSAGSSTWVLSNEVRYAYDGNLVIQERNSWNLPQVTYTRGKDLSGGLEGAGGIGGLLARTDHSILNSQPSAAHSYYFADGNGNVTMLINTQQIAVAKYQYDPFGNTLSLSGPLAEANLYRFSSKERHDNSGLSYYLYRYYAPELQRWLNRDPLSEPGFETLRMAVAHPQIQSRLYVFVNNAPTHGYDIHGLDYITKGIIGFVKRFFGPFAGAVALCDLWSVADVCGTLAPGETTYVDTRGSAVLSQIFFGFDIKLKVSKDKNNKCTETFFYDSAPGPMS